MSGCLHDGAMTAAALAHEATAIWEVRVAYHSPHQVRLVDQHVHIFLESLPSTALAAVACLHGDDLRTPPDGRSR